MKDNIYTIYKKTVNMTFSELLDWNNNICSTKASVDRMPIKRNLILLGTPSQAWTKWHENQAKKVISFNARHNIHNSGNKVKGCNVSKRTIALKNWAIDPNKK